ncbi:MAG: nucleotidyltransferase domain-containing protein [Nitrososphaerales archaeon]
MWIPSWLGKVYSKLYMKFKGELFTFQEAKEPLSFDENKLAVAFSKLHSNRILLIFEATRPRMYRLLDPQNFVLLASNTIQNLDKIPQERYVKLLCDAFRLLSKSFNLSSLAVYGSVARGVARKESDIDILIVSNDFFGSLGLRIERLFRVEEMLRSELAWLRKKDIYTSLSFYPLREEEAKKNPLFFLDLTEEAIILYDRDHFLEMLLTDFKTKLLKLGAKRAFINKKNWYWDLKPDYKFGEEIPI